MNQGVIRLMQLLQFSDSTFPVGAFSFSNGLETAVNQGVVYDATTLLEYTNSIITQAAFSDGISAIHAYRATQNNDYERVKEIDNCLFRFKMNEESRIMLKRMGRKMSELCKTFIDNELLYRWVNDIENNKTKGTYPVAQGIIFATAQLTEKELFASHQYGVANMVLSAALRCVKVSHYDTQSILHTLSRQSDYMFREVVLMDLEEMQSFVPQIDIFASLHEKGTMRMFMN